jgi:hypothetical protein
MPCEVIYRYPDEDAHTVQFAPTVSPRIDGSGESDDENILVDVMGDGYTMHATKTGETVRHYVHEWVELTDADRTALRAFKEAVAGNEFRMTDPNTGGYVTVKFDQEGFVLAWTPSLAASGAIKWSTVVKMRSA